MTISAWFIEVGIGNAVTAEIIGSKCFIYSGINGLGRLRMCLRGRQSNDNVRHN
jgi:hypothetical protein